MNKGLQAHDSLLEDIVHRLREQRKAVRHNMTYELGEIDIIVYDHGHIDCIYEVKARDSYKNRKHAEEQLRRAFNYFGGGFNAVYVSRIRHDITAKRMITRYENGYNKNNKN